MNAKKDSFEESVKEAQEEAENFDKWPQIAGVFDRKELLQKELLNELRYVAKSKKSPQADKVNYQITLGPMADESWADVEFAEQHVKESLLKMLLENNFITKFDVNVRSIYEKFDDPQIPDIPYEVVVANIEFNPTQLWKGASLFLLGLNRIIEAKYRLVDPSVVLYVTQDGEGNVFIIYKHKPYKLTKLRYGFKNDEFFDYVYKRPDRKIPMREIEQQFTNKESKKSVFTILGDLGFIKDLQEIFFPNVSSAAVKFSNYFNAEDLKAKKFNWKRVKKLIDDLEKRRDKARNRKK